MVVVVAVGGGGGEGSGGGGGGWEMNGPRVSPAVTTNVLLGMGGEDRGAHHAHHLLRCADAGPPRRWPAVKNDEFQAALRLFWRGCCCSWAKTSLGGTKGYHRFDSHH